MFFIWHKETDFSLLDNLDLLPGKLILNVCKKVKCDIFYKNLNESTELYIANSYGKYMNDEVLSDDHCYFVKYDDNTIGGVCNMKKKNIWDDASSREK